MRYTAFIQTQHDDYKLTCRGCGKEFRDWWSAYAIARRSAKSMLKAHNPPIGCLEELRQQVSAQAVAIVRLGVALDGKSDAKKAAK